MSKKDAKNIIASYRKKQKLGPYIIGGLAILLAVVGIVLLGIYLFGGGGGGLQISLFNTKTPTPTETPTPTPVTPTATFTMTPTITETPTPTFTSTPSAPFEYEVLEGDNCTVIAEKFDVDLSVLLVLNKLTSSCFITPGQIILIPLPGQALPTPTPLPDNTAPGTLIEHIVRPGDNLFTLAEKLNSTVERIIEETNQYRRDNDLDEMENANDIYVGDTLIIPVNIITPVPTATKTATPTP